MYNRLSLILDHRFRPLLAASARESFVKHALCALKKSKDHTCTPVSVTKLGEDKHTQVELILSESPAKRGLRLAVEEMDLHSRDDGCDSVRMIVSRASAMRYERTQIMSTNIIGLSKCTVLSSMIFVKILFVLDAAKRT